MLKNNLISRQLLSFSAGLTLAMGATSAAWAGATTDGTMGATQTFSGDFTIPDTIGTTVGQNLIHSFSTFNIDAGESATFTGPDAINNVISRVTGSDPSVFNGALISNIPSANFYFMNPNGVIFKEHAALMVDGSFYATTSDFINLGQDGVIFADPASASVLTSSPPSAFGFLDSNPGQISMEGPLLVKDYNLIIPDGASFGLVGGDIKLDMSQSSTNDFNDFGAPYTLISMTGRSFEMVSVASTGEAVLGADGYDLTSFDTLGSVTLAGNTVLDATDVYIRGGSIFIDDAVIAPGLFYALGAVPDATLTGTIDLAARDLVSITGTAPFPYLRPDGGAYVAGITVFGGNPLDGAPAIDGSDIYIKGGNILVSGAAAVADIRYGPGVAGDINITGNTVDIRNGGLVTNINAFDGAGGNITVTADEVILDGENNSGSQTGLNATSNFSVIYLATDGSVADPTLVQYTTADAGTITVNATGPGGLTIKNGASINTESRAFGRAGDINIEASNINLSRDGKSVGAIASQSLFAGDAGNIDIHATGDININSGFEITGNSIGTGMGGTISVAADGSINISGEGSGIASAASDPTQEVKDLLGAIYNPILNAAGPTYSDLVDILNLYLGLTGTPDELTTSSSMYDVMSAMYLLGVLTHPDFNPAATPDAGDAGSVSVTASALNMDDLSKISSSTNTNGNGGSIDVQVYTLAMSNGAEIRSRSGLPDVLSGELKVGSGNGGSISINASDSINMQSDSSISASSLGAGTAGNISVAGNSLDMTSSSITSQAEGSGNGGDISVIAADSVNMTDSSSVSASSLGAGFAGNISIDAGNLLNMSGSNITTQALESDGGNIQIVALNKIFLDLSEISTSVESGFGGGGNINIDPEFVILKQSSILANAYGGPGGNINIIANNFIATPDSIVNASSALGIDGTVNISAPDETVSKDLAVLPKNYLDVTSLLSDRCGTTSGASSLVDAGPGGRDIDPDGYLPSFAAATDYNNEEKGESKSVSSGSNWWVSYAQQPELQLAQMTCTF